MPHLGYEQLVYNRLGEEYPRLISHVLRFGVPVDSRAGVTRELTNLQLVLTEPEFCVIDRDGFSIEFMTEEILQLLAGVYDAERLRAAVPRAADMITDATAYGPRVAEQLYAVEQELRQSPGSRRAVVYVGRADDLIALANEGEAARRAGEMPCTLVWQFLVRTNQLHMTVHMRSWDLVWGLSYDVPSFVAVQLALARALGVKVGRYVHTAGSAHVYERHFDLDTKPVTDILSNHVGFIFRDTITATRENALAQIGYKFHAPPGAGPVITPIESLLTPEDLAINVEDSDPNSEASLAEDLIIAEALADGEERTPIPPNEWPVESLEVLPSLAGEQWPNDADEELTSPEQDGTIEDTPDDSEPEYFDPDAA